MIKTLSKYTDSLAIPKKIKDYLQTFKFVFNPSFIQGLEANYLAVRVYNATSESIESLLFYWVKKENFEIINLSEHFKKEADIDKVADPKLFILNDGAVCGTFNTGYKREGNNAIFFFELDKIKVKSYYNCQYNNRSRIEKNWVFYQHNQALYALYSINPLKILQCTKANRLLACEELHCSMQDKRFKNLSFGSPLLNIKSDKYVFIAHKKYYYKNRRIYTGIPMVFDPHKFSITARKVQIIHSLKSILGAKKKFNKNLISCTYFSGITKNDEDVILTYGINDVSWNVSKIKIGKLWKI